MHIVAVEKAEVFPLADTTQHNYPIKLLHILNHTDNVGGLKAGNAPLDVVHLSRSVLYQTLLYSRVAVYMDHSLLHTLLPGSLLKSKGQDICSWQSF